MALSFINLLKAAKCLSKVIGSVLESVVYVSEKYQEARQNVSKQIKFKLIKLQQTLRRLLFKKRCQIIKNTYLKTREQNIPFLHLWKLNSASQDFLPILITALPQRCGFLRAANGSVMIMITCLSQMTAEVEAERTTDLFSWWIFHGIINTATRVVCP